ncbi:DNA translocase FtsK [Marinilabiliaceae bacterium JC017]|nr:DNA translocase FtsK [Marinilabiliaceae bacterium JC017]
MAKQKKKKKTNSTPINIRAKQWLENLKHFRFRFFFGIITVCFAFYLLLAFFSFFFTGYADKSKFDLPMWDLIASSEIAVQNWTGKLGAYLADTFINQGFGVASFSFIVILFVLGFRFLGARILPLRKTIFHALFITIWVSLTLGVSFSSTVNERYLLMGGTHGYFLSIWLRAAIGLVGTIITIFSAAIIYLSITFDDFYWMLKRLFTKKAPDSSTKDNLTKKQEEPTTQEPLTEIDNEISEEPIVTQPIAHNEIQDAEPEQLSFSTDNNESQDSSIAEKGVALELDTKVDPAHRKESNDIDLSLTIEKADQEEFIEEPDDDEPLEDYDPTLDLSSYKLPSIELLDDHKSGGSEVGEEELISNKNRIVKTLEDYKIQIKSIKATVGPTITLYEIVPAPGVRISKIKNLEDDIALSLAALGIRIIAPIPGRGTIGIEVPNSEPEVVSMRTIIASKKFQNTKYELPIAFGKTISNDTFVLDLAKAPHMLVAGATGQGKSVGLNAIITSLLYKKHPSQLKFVLVDPKKVELNIYAQIENHFLAKMPDEEDPIITDVQKVVNTLNSLTIEMDDRYDLLKKAHARNIKEYNHKFVKRQLNPEKGHRFLPYIVVIIDEFADLIMTAGKEVEMPIARIAQLARAVGIHMIIATQRPSTNIITGVIKANFPTRVAFKVASMIDSRTILDSPGANQLIGRGDMLISQGSDLVRVQCAFVDTPEVEKINNSIGEQRGYASAFLLPEYSGGDSGSEPGEVDMSKRDQMFEEAAKVVVANQSGSTSLIQRRFSIGYNRAGRIIDQLEAAGIVGPFEGSKARQVLVPDEVELDRILETYR